jgi:hypothetical protein
VGKKLSRLDVSIRAVDDCVGILAGPGSAVREAWDFVQNAARQSKGSAEQQTDNTGSLKLPHRLQAVLPMVKNGMNSVQIFSVRGVIADAIEQLRIYSPGTKRSSVYDRKS